MIVLFWCDSKSLFYKAKLEQRASHSPCLVIREILPELLLRQDAIWRTPPGLNVEAAREGPLSIQLPPEKRNVRAFSGGDLHVAAALASTVSMQARDLSRPDLDYIILAVSARRIEVDVLDARDVLAIG
jgi:hypothetical protein